MGPRNVACDASSDQPEQHPRAAHERGRRAPRCWARWRRCGRCRRTAWSGSRSCISPSFARGCPRWPSGALCCRWSRRAARGCAPLGMRRCMPCVGLLLRGVCGMFFFPVSARGVDCLSRRMLPRMLPRLRPRKSRSLRWSRRSRSLRRSLLCDGGGPRCHALQGVGPAAAGARRQLRAHGARHARDGGGGGRGRAARARAAGRRDRQRQDDAGAADRAAGARARPLLQACMRLRPGSCRGRACGSPQ
jgi:hypothetical protein